MFRCNHECHCIRQDGDANSHSCADASASPSPTPVDCDFSNCNVVRDKLSRATPLSRPGYLQSATDPSYGSKITRNTHLGPYEGNASMDGRYIVMVGTRNSDNRQVVFMIDTANKTKSIDIDLAAIGVSALDWASSSASGKYIVINGVINVYADSTKVLNHSGQQVGPHWTDYDLPSHFDLTYDSLGNEIAVGVSQSVGAGRVIMRRLVDGTITTALSGFQFSSHHSTRNYQRPGWAYVSATQDLYAVKLDGSQSIQRFTASRSTFSTYDAQPHGVPSPDGKRIIYASDWGVAGGAVSAFVVDIRGLCN